MKRFFFFGLFAATAALGDITAPAQVKCAVTKVTPADARFFGFANGPVIGDTTSIDLAATEILNLKFSSGAIIGTTIRKHPLIKKDLPEWTSYGFYEATFKSLSNGADYHAVLNAQEDDKGKIAVSLDVVESRPVGRLTLNAVELECGR